MQNQRDIITTRTEKAEDQIGNIKDKIMENNKAEEEKKNLLDHEYRLRKLSVSTKCSNIHITRVPKEEWGKGAESLFEQIIVKNFPNLGRETGIQVQEAWRTPLKVGKNRSTRRHIIVKFAIQT